MVEVWVLEEARVEHNGKAHGYGSSNDEAITGEGHIEVVLPRKARVYVQSQSLSGRTIMNTKRGIQKYNRPPPCSGRYFLDVMNVSMLYQPSKAVSVCLWSDDRQEGQGHGASGYGLSTKLQNLSHTSQEAGSDGPIGKLCSIAEIRKTH